jgi:ATP-dependent Lhr-like helicase
MAATLGATVGGWFAARFGEPSEPQARGWPLIAAGRDVLIAAPTGSGKTLAAFLIAIDRLARQAESGPLDDAVQVVYVSPLKALANDIHKNLERPLAELGMAGRIRAAVRTGDTLAGERQAMLRRPPHILVTTPESLYILLTSAGGRKLLRPVRTVIVDEIHALVANKRGAHLALSLERLDALAGAPQRIGLSATARPLEEVARFLAGGRPLPAIVEVRDRRHWDLAVEVPSQELGPVAANEDWEERYERLAELAREHRSTLVFVSTRRLAERVAHRMRERLGEDAVAAHHGSLSRAIRLRAEERFQRGELRMMVATASLELGLDVGSVELVCQLGSPRQFAAAWQRVGRSGHWKGAIPKGCFFALTRDDLIECAALVGALRGARPAPDPAPDPAPVTEALRVPAWPRDILAQQIVAAVASCDAAEGWGEDELFALARRAWPYRERPREEFDALLELLSEGISTRRGRRGALLHRDGVHHRLRPRRGARMAAILNGGAIAETASYVVQAEPENLPIGSLDEDFAIESNAGDIILLGTHSWKVRGVETGRVRVEDAHGAPPTVPFWLGEAPGRTAELSAAVAALRAWIGALPPQAWPELANACGLSESGARQALAYLHTAQVALGAMPTTRQLVAERFFDDGGGMQLVIHAPFGAAINKAWGMALRKRFCRGFDFELQASASDNGLALALSEQHSFPLETIFGFLRAATVQPILEQAVLQAPIFATRWRWTAGRALALQRFSGGRKLAPQIQRMRAEDLLAAAFPMQVGCQDNHGGEDLEIPHHPYVLETMRDCLHEFLDLDGLREVLRGIESGEIAVAAVDTPAPSGLAHEILNVAPYGFLDEAPLEERRARALDLRAATVAPHPPGELDPAAVAAVCAEAWPQLESAEELHDLLLSLFWMPPDALDPGWRAWLEPLRASGRVLQLRGGWIAAERAPALAGAAGAGRSGEAPAGLAGAVWPGVEFLGAAPSLEEAVLARMVGGWMEILGPVTEPELAQKLHLSHDDVSTALLALEGQGRVLRGAFGWCERGLLARIQRRMVRRLRAEIEPVAPAVFERFLRRWQHLDVNTRLHGRRGLAAVLEQMQGFEAAASAWEAELLPARVADYAPALLDELCLGGEFAWARISPRKSRLAAGGASARVTPNRNSPVTFFRRADAAWLLPAAGWQPPAQRNGSLRLSPAAAQVLAKLERRGASFFAPLAGDGLVPSQVEDALWELVAAGLATADGFDNLRAFLDPKRRAGQGAGSAARPRHSPGRWTLVQEAAPDAGPPPATPAERELARQALAEQQARQWLRRYGVIFKAGLDAESSALGWYEVLLACRRLEARGEIRGGRFVSGFAGEQYALPQAVEALRILR